MREIDNLKFILRTVLIRHKDPCGESFPIVDSLTCETSNAGADRRAALSSPGVGTFLEVNLNELEISRVMMLLLPLNFVVSNRCAPCVTTSSILIVLVIIV